MSQRELAHRTGVTEKHISTIVNGIKPISIAYAKKLEYAFGIDASFWINLQSGYDKELFEYEEMNNIKKNELDILRILKDMVVYFTQVKLLPSGLNDIAKVVELRKILGVSHFPLH